MFFRCLHNLATFRNVTYSCCIQKPKIIQILTVNKFAIVLTNQSSSKMDTNKLSERFLITGGHIYGQLCQTTVIFVDLLNDNIKLASDSFPLFFILRGHDKIMADSRLAPSQWGTALLCNSVSQWLGASLESDLNMLRSLIWQISQSFMVKRTDHFIPRRINFSDSTVNY